MRMMSQAEIGLAEIDEKIAASDRNIREVGSLVSKLAVNGCPTAEIEKLLTLMRQVLQSLQHQRHTIVETLDGDDLPPRIARSAKRTRRRTSTQRAPVAASTGGWRAIYLRLGRA